MDLMKAIPCARYAGYMALFEWNCKEGEGSKPRTGLRRIEPSTVAVNNLIG
jgi:hypothetical protein